MGKKGMSSPANVALGWLRKSSMRMKVLIGATIGVVSLVTLWLTVHDHNHFFVASEAVHVAGILVLIYKLTTQKTCSGLSLKSQELTAMFLAVRLVCSTVMEGDIHTVLDFTTLVSTIWVIYMIRFKLKSTHIKDLDNFPLYYVIIPSVALAVFIHPHTQHFFAGGILWALGVYMEALSVLPQLHMIQNAKMVEPFTAHYVFALGVSRFLSCAHWIIRIYETRGKHLFFFGSGYFWLLSAFVAEMVQTFILTDFCYYYVKSFVQGQLIMRMPV